MADDTQESQQSRSADRRPVPDPTNLTTDALDQLREDARRDIAHTQDTFYLSIAALRDQLEQRFSLGEAYRIEQKGDQKNALDAALAAQKDSVVQQTLASERAIAKSEMAVTKQLEQLAATFATSIGGLTITINDLKERVGRIENLKVGAGNAYAGLYAMAGFIVLLITIGGFVFATRK